MLSLVRSGPKALLISTDAPDDLEKYLGRFISQRGSFAQVFDATQEDNSIVISTGENLDNPVRFSAVPDAYSLSVDMDELLCAMIRDGAHDCIKQLRMATRMILIRGMGDMEKCLDALSADFPGERSDVPDLLNRFTDQGAVVAFTAKPLHLSCSLSDLYPRALYIPGSYSKTFSRVRSQALKYLNAGMDNRDWVDLEIRIFDRLSAYQLHYQRLLQMTEALELGYIIGESWGKDSPRFMMTVNVYRVRMVTFLDVNEIKRFLVGLEYLGDGMRVADHDVYYNRKKISWGETSKGYAKTREELGKIYRDKIVQRLSPEGRTSFEDLEAEIRRLQKE